MTDTPVDLSKLDLVVLPKKFFVLIIGNPGPTFEIQTNLSQGSFTEELANQYQEKGYILQKTSKDVYFIIKDFSAIAVLNEIQYAEHTREIERQQAAMRFNPGRA